MKKNMIISIAMALMITLSVASLALARGGGSHFHGGAGERTQLRAQDCPVMAALSEEQQQELLQTTREHREWMYPQKQRMISRQAELKALLATPGTDPARIQETRNEILELNRQMAERRLDHKIKMSRDFNIQPGIKGQFREGRRFQDSARSMRPNCPRINR